MECYALSDNSLYNNNLKSLENSLKSISIRSDKLVIMNYQEPYTTGCRTTAYSPTSHRATGQDQARIAGQRNPHCGVGSIDAVCCNLTPPPPPAIFFNIRQSVVKRFSPAICFPRGRYAMRKYIIVLIVLLASSSLVSCEKSDVQSIEPLKKAMLDGKNTLETIFEGIAGYDGSVSWYV